MKRTKIKELLSQQPTGQAVLVQGWVRSRRDSKEVSFIVLNDGSCMGTAQVVVDNAFLNANGGDEWLRRINTGACIGVWAAVQPSQGKEPFDLIPSKIEIYGEAGEGFPLQKKGATMEYLREIGHLRVRGNTFGAVFRVRHAAAFAIHEFFNKKGFFYAHTPIITASDCEGAGEMFAVTTLDLSKPPRNEAGEIDFTQDFFGKPAHLTVSGQLNGELLAMGLGEIYTFGPTFRAENSNTTRHLAEFWMIEPEAAFYEAEDNQALAEEFIKYVLKYVMDHCLEDLKFFDQFIAKGLLERLHFVLDNAFQKITYTEAISILEKSGKKFEVPVSWGMDMGSEHERWLVEEHFRKPVIVINYPKDIKAFYMKQNDDGKTVRAMDVLFPGIGEIIGGSQREENYEKLLARIRELKLVEADYWWYLDTRRFGTAPHSGFGLGFERLMLFLTGMGNIRDVIPFPRTPGNAEF